MAARCSSLRSSLSSSKALRNRGSVQGCVWMTRKIFANWFLVGLWLLRRNSSRRAKTSSWGILSQQSRLPVMIPSTSIIAIIDSGCSLSLITADRRLSIACMQRLVASFATRRPISVSKVQRRTAQTPRRASGPASNVLCKWLVAGCACGQGRPSRGMNRWRPAKRFANLSLWGCLAMSVSRSARAGPARDGGAMTKGRRMPQANGRSKTSSVHSSAGCLAAMPFMTLRSHPRSHVARR
mmetsp:Transcript_33483/g.99769  ORF Transcript_33483/g.99769 Transcript_33483/m.99769 type:complete len:239 (-) Transcript_33483:276-992(-)